MQNKASLAQQSKEQLERTLKREKELQKEALDAAERERAAAASTAQKAKEEADAKARLVEQERRRADAQRQEWEGEISRLVRELETARRTHQQEPWQSSQREALIKGLEEQLRSTCSALKTSQGALAAEESRRQQSQPSPPPVDPRREWRPSLVLQLKSPQEEEET